jgi:hypothetical protein
MPDSRPSRTAGHGRQLAVGGYTVRQLASRKPTLAAWVALAVVDPERTSDASSRLPECRRPTPDTLLQKISEARWVLAATRRLSGAARQ